MLPEGGGCPEGVGEGPPSAGDGEAAVATTAGRERRQATEEAEYVRLVRMGSDGKKAGDLRAAAGAGIVARTRQVERQKASARGEVDTSLQGRVKEIPPQPARYHGGVLSHEIVFIVLSPGIASV